MMKESGAHAVKLEGGKPIVDSVRGIVDAGIPVMGHLGLTPQSIYKFGTYKVRATESSEADQLIEDAKLLEEAGCFALVLEKIPASLATQVTKILSIPTIGIGAGSGCDGQVLVAHDMLGLNNDFSPRFVRRYADLHSVMTDAVQNYIKDVKDGSFPSQNEQYD
jgi:3-methyl-2-oxobutanoate hydroxymethyltransferase